MPEPESFRMRILDLALLTFALALLLGPWTAMDQADSGWERRRAAGLLFNAVLTTAFIAWAILARCSGHRRGEEWLSWAFVALLGNQAIATAVPMLAIVLMPIGVVIAGALLFYVVGQLEV